MKIAIVGTGIAGLTAASLLHKEHDITVYESESRLGGHANTVTVEEEDNQVNIDTGFIVFNDWTYPLYEELISNLDVEPVNSEMSFSVRCSNTGYEWAGNNINSLVFNQDNWHQIKSYQILFDFMRFNKLAKQFIQDSKSEYSLGEFLEAHKFSRAFIDYYILPMGAAIWSSVPNQIHRFPALSFLRFFNNHGLLNVKNRPQWKTIKGGSTQYVKELSRPFLKNIKTNSPVTSIKRIHNQVEIIVENQPNAYFDQVFIACHSNQALAMLANPNKTEQQLLGDIQYQENSAVLHTDASVMPRRKNTWSSWNYTIPKQQTDRVTVSYYMNRLQPLNTEKDYFVSLNQDEMINPEKIIRTCSYDHPVFNHAAIDAQRRFDDINQAERLWFCGAYWRNGFHEDGVWSAHQAITRFNEYLNDAQLSIQRAS